jgi:hypothetical protein
MDELVTVAVFDNAAEADRAKERLGYVGIQAYCDTRGWVGKFCWTCQEQAQAALDFLDYSDCPRIESVFPGSRPVSLSREPKAVA